jgi:hypothetical protein
VGARLELTVTRLEAMMDEWFYFGCHKEPGHYIFKQGMKRAHFDKKIEKLNFFDGKLPPQDCADGYVATISRLGGWGLTALAFWDYSVDKRGGCNSVIFAPSLTIDPDAMLTEAHARFPEVFARLPKPVRLLSSNASYKTICRITTE